MRDLFPEITVGDFSRKDQMYKALDELVELEQAYADGNRDEVLKESIDVIHSVFTFLYLNEYKDYEISNAIREVVEKNRRRGYYDKPSEKVSYQGRGDK
jgi:phosphoribosyl-ATP pyrophosphohydrolase